MTLVFKHIIRMAKSLIVTEYLQQKECTVTKLLYISHLKTKEPKMRLILKHNRVGIKRVPFIFSLNITECFQTNTLKPLLLEEVQKKKVTVICKPKAAWP